MALAEGDLEYGALLPRLAGFVKRGRGESAALLGWFLENIFRLDDVEADDALCDASRDKGADAIYVDHNAQEIVILQSWLRTGPGGHLGDVELKTLSGTLDQFASPESIDVLLNGSANEALKTLIRENDIRDLVEKKYAVKGVYVTNQPLNADGREYLKHQPQIEVYDSVRIAAEYVDIDAPDWVAHSFTFAVDDSGMIASTAPDDGQLFLFLASGKELIALRGIADGSLFAQNVRLPLPKSKVNKDIRDTVSRPEEHAAFPLFHNGITLLCRKATYEAKGKTLTIEDYSVVNGAQSLRVMHAHGTELSDELRVALKVGKVASDTLAAKITTRSNNQNSIKGRDQRSNDNIQRRLQADMAAFTGNKIFLEIKRGEEKPAGAEVITNERAGRLLLAFDNKRPWETHQIYKVFDDDYGDVFSHPYVKAARILMLDKIMKMIETTLAAQGERPFLHYRLTAFFVLTVIRRVLERTAPGRELIADPTAIMTDRKRLGTFEGLLEPTIRGIVSDLCYELEDDKHARVITSLDYKSGFKSPSDCDRLASALLGTYDRDVARDKVKPIEF